MQHGNVRKIRNPGNRLQEPKALNRTTIKEIVQKQASHIVKRQTNRMRIDATDRILIDAIAPFQTTTFRLGDFEIGKRHIQTMRWLGRIDGFEAHQQLYLVQKGGPLALKILSGQVPRAVGFGSIVAVSANCEFFVKEIKSLCAVWFRLLVRLGFGFGRLVKKEGEACVARDRMRINQQVRTDRRKRSHGREPSAG